MAVYDKSHRLDYDGLQIECDGIVINGVEQTFGSSLPNVSSSYGTGTSSAGAITLNTRAGRITTESLATAAGSAYTLTVTNSQCAAGDIVLAVVRNGTNSGGQLAFRWTVPAAGSFQVVALNGHASAAFNGTIIVDFVIIKTT